MKQTSKCEYCNKNAGWNNYLGLYICKECRDTKVSAYKQNSSNEKLTSDGRNIKEREVNNRK